MSRRAEWLLLAALLGGIVFDGLLRAKLDARIIESNVAASRESRRMTEEIQELREQLWAMNRRPM